DRQPDVRDGEDDRAEKRVPEDAVVEDAREVRPPDADALVRDQLREPVLLEREPEELVERVPEDRRKHGEHREDQEVRDRAATGSSPRERAPPRPRDGLGGGSHAGGLPAQWVRAG